jgi:CheY-like chemotaxis protein
MAAPDGPVVQRQSPVVLVVEDDPATRRFYTLTLAANGLLTEEAHNGFQAFDRAASVVPDLILTDIAIPGIDGIELCRRLRADSRMTTIPILAVTGYGDRQYHDRAIAAGANHVLIKPFLAQTLIAEVHRLLRTSREIGNRSIA